MLSPFARHTALSFRSALLVMLALGCAQPLQQPVAEAPAPIPVSAAQPGLPARLSDTELWGLTSDMSEPGGSFQSDNFVSNERTLPGLAAALAEGWKPGGVYIGVGPEQNFAYIAALKPRMVFLLDIRRQMVMHQLMYKALFELSPTRAEFVSRLFSKPQPAALTTSSTVQEIWDAYRIVEASPELFARNLAAVRDHLTKTHGFGLSQADLASVTYVYTAFHEIGPNITYNGYGRGGGGGGVNYAQITADVDASGVARSFLANEANYGVIRDLHLKNLIVPVVADFAGPTGIRAVANYLKARNATVTAFYTSNVESYLFREFGAADRFYANVASLPLDSNTTFIRPRGGGGRGMMIGSGGFSVAPLGTPLGSPTSELCPIIAFLRAHAEGRITSYNEALACRL